MEMTESQPMPLTDPQRRTMDRLLGAGQPRPMFPADLPQRLRDRIEEAVRGAELAEQLWLSKDKLNSLAGCEGAFAAKLMGEGDAFEHSVKTAAGVLQHKAIEVEVGAREQVGPIEAVDIAVDRLANKEERFAEYWRGLTPPERDEITAEASRRVSLFQGSFPPLRELRRELAPVAEMGVKAELSGGDLVLSGRIDLVLGVQDRTDPTRATRLALDLKTGGAYPAHAEDNRFYALLLTLRFGVPPYRVGSLFLESGEWQAEDVTEQALFHAADRVVAAVRSSTALTNGREPVLTPGHHCSWCPRATTCPVAELPAG
ncbi:MAG: PD-(D/E)XK nuclease family protein [Actinomycetota bacterium]